MKKKLIAVLLCTAMVLSMIPGAVFAGVVPSLNRYVFTYHNEFKSSFDSSSGTYKSYLEGNFRSKYVQSESESVFVTQFSDDYQIEIICDEAITYKDLLGATGILKNVYSNNGLKEPALYIGAGLKESADLYEDVEEFNKECDSTEMIPLEGAKFYMLKANSINSVDLSVDVPVCGTEIKEAESSLPGYPDKPADVTIPEGAHYHVYNISGAPISVWAEGEGSSLDALRPFIGTIKGGTEYKLVVNLEPEFGYRFKEGIGKSDVLINGKEVLTLDMEEDSPLLVIAGAETAVHEWGDGKVTKKPTSKEEGEMTYTCKHCDFVKTEKIAKLKANTLKVSGKTAAVKFSKLKKKNQTLKVSKVLKFANKGQGTLTYKRAKGNKKIVINKTTGKVTVKKGLKKGKYKMTVKVTAEGDSTHALLTKKVTFTVKIK